MDHEQIFYRTVSRIVHDLGAPASYSNATPYLPGKEPPDPTLRDLTRPKQPLCNVVQLSPELERMARRARVYLQDNATPAYVTCDDFIRLPRPSCFRSMAHFKNAMFHEMGHWTASRVGRLTDRYSVEEITAEMTAAVLCDAFDVKGDFHHAAYIAHYAQQSNERLSAGLAHAKRASHYLLRLAEQETP